MKLLNSITLLAVSMTILLSCSSSTKSYQDLIKQHQEELNTFYSNPETTPLKPKELILFNESGGNDFFPINPGFRIMAHFERHDEPDTIYMPTSSEKIKSFDTYGVAHFKLNRKDYHLKLYQNYALKKMKEYQNDLFLPFKDMTSGTSTYGGGRYIDLHIPNGDSILIDFNLAYHPYCAYTSGYSCPVPPAENYLSLPIEAGIKLSAYHQKH